MDITEKWLGEIGGWAAMKAARSLVQARAVADASRAGDTVQGVVGAGKTKFRAGLRITSRSDITNLCTCPASRGRGVICEHSLAVALAVLHPSQAPAAASAGQGAVAGSTLPSLRPSPPAALKPAAERKPTKATGRFEVFLPESLFEASSGPLRGAGPARFSIFLRFTPAASTADSEVSADDRLAGWLGDHGLPAATTPLALDGKTVSGLLAALGEHPAVFLGKPGKTDPQTLTVMVESVRLPVTFQEIPDSPDGPLMARCTRSEHVTGLVAVPAERGQGLWFFCQQTGAVFRTEPPPDLACESLLKELAEKPCAEPKSASWLVAHRETLDQCLQITLEGPALSRLHVVPVPCEVELRLDGSLQAVTARLDARFGTHTWPVSPGGLFKEENNPLFPIHNEETKHLFYTRNETLESRAIRALEEAGFAFRSGSEWLLTGRDAVLRFYGSDLPKLRRMVKVQEEDRWRTCSRQLKRISPRIDREPSNTDAQRESRDWLAFEIAYEAPDGFRLPRAAVLQMIRAGRKSVKGPGGAEYVLDADGCEDLEESLQDIQVQMTSEGGKSDLEHLQYLENSGDLENVETSVKDWIPVEELRSKLPEIATLLRPYQETGIRWLEARIRAGRGALLADDMGLGKTFQAIAVIRLIRQKSPTSGPVLVVCPKTLMENWRIELVRFAPGLQVVTWAGSGRFQDQISPKQSDVILSSFSLIGRDLEYFKSLQISALILDEASFIRNPDTDTAKAVFQLRAPCRVALTGTPIENGVTDIWSIMAFLAPGYLGPKKAFQERFEKPVLNEATGAPREQGGPAGRLRRLIRPFYLRRTKQEVLPELPEKIEEIQWCELSRPQMEVYRRVLEEGQEEVRQAARRSGQGSVKLTMFTVLLRLRQICCDLRLAGLPEAALKGLGADEISGKLAALQELLDLRSGNGQKMLIFSQFVGFLRNVEAILNARKMGYSYLDGQSEDRARQIQAFKTEPNRRVFLISLKAGGYGLNLAEADQVVLMDPWWNPAVEAQAIDRAHRFGQQRVVTATRMISRGTVEEKILKLQQSKRGIVGAVIDSGRSGSAGLSVQELEELLIS